MAPQSRNRPTTRQRSERVIRGDRARVVMGSDYRGEAHGSCALCGVEADLVLGHIIPRWAGQWMKAEEGDGVIGEYRSIGVATVSGDLPKHYLFCLRCDNFLGAAEDYLASLTKGSQVEMSRIGLAIRRHNGVAFVSGVQPVLLYRAVAGIMLKVHLSQHQLFVRDRLNQAELEELRSALMADDYPSHRFAMFTGRWVSSVFPSEGNPRSAISAGFKRERTGVFMDTYIAGMNWVLHIGPAEAWCSTNLGPRWRSYIVGPRPLLVEANEWTAHAMVANVSGTSLDVADHPGWDAVAARDPCPCGLGQAFADCCAGRWLDDVGVAPTAAGVRRTTKGGMRWR